MTSLFNFDNIGEFIGDKNLNKDEINKVKCNNFTTIDNTLQQNCNTINNENQDIEKIYNILDIALEKLVLSNNIYSLIISGQPGTGKTTRTINKLNTLILNNHILEAEKDYFIISGTSTAKGLYDYLFKYKDNKILIFDDCDSILLKDDSISILKAALDDSKNRKISWIKSFKKDEQDNSEFIFSSKIIFITNLPQNKIDESLITRSNLFNLYMTNNQIIYVATKLKNELLNNINDEKKMQVIELLKKNQHKIKSFSLRTFKRLNALIDNNTSVQSIQDIIEYYL